MPSAAAAIICPRTKLVINLSPAHVRKTGTAFDLPITLGILMASEQVADLGKLKDYWIAGEIGLDGSIYPVRGALCMAYQAKNDGFKGMVVPRENANEASLIKGIDVYAVRHLKEVISFIQADCALEPVTQKKYRHPLLNLTPDFKDVKGQHNVKRAMEIAAAGGHNSLLIGPPGIGENHARKKAPFHSSPNDTGRIIRNNPDIQCIE